MFLNSFKQIMLSALFHTLVYDLSNEKEEAKSSTLSLKNLGSWLAGSCWTTQLTSQLGQVESGSRSNWQCNEMSALPFRWTWRSSQFICF